MVSFLTKKVVEKHAFSGSSGNIGGDLEEQGVLNSIPREMASEKMAGGTGSLVLPMASLSG